MATNDASTCPLCRHENVSIFAVGDCLHPVCYVCAVKMRILCEETYCAICRQELARIYFVSNLSETREKIDPTLFSSIDDTGVCGIYYSTKADWIRRKAERLLRNFCPICNTEFESFEVLRQHAQTKHRVFYCDLCVEHLNLFPHERKFYTRAELVQHLRFGDKDDKSMRGHPLCKFCNDHFLDNDQLYKHMRQEHYYCHLCSTDSVYYSTFELLRDHYRSAHFLCEIDQCRDVQFTNVFPNEFEFRAHQAAQHSKNRAAARQLGKVQVEFQSTSVRDRRQQRETTNNTDTQNQNDREETNRDGNAAASVPSIDEFPTLGQRATASATASATTQALPQQRGAWANDLRGNYSNEDFPALTRTATNSSNQPRGAWGENQSQMTTISSSTTRKNVADSSSNIKEDFPALQSAANPRISSSVSLVSAWSNANKSAKNAKANKKTQPQMRMNSNRILNDYDDEDDCIRRPMSALMISTTPQVSSNITMISSTDPSATSAATNKNQSVPKSHDFPALPTTVRTPPVNPVPSGAWATNAATAPTQPTTNQQKKKSGLSSKKKFLEEIRTMSSPQPPTVTTDSPMVGLSELGRRLITEETPEVKKEEKPLSSPPAPSAENQNDKKTTTPSKKKKSPKTTTTNDENPVEKQSEPSRTVTPLETTPTKSSKPVESVPIVETSLPISAPPAPPPPGFSASVGSVQVPPGFNMMSSSQPSYIFSSSHNKDKENFREKLLKLFDGDMNLFVEYDKFCQAFAEKSISSTDFLKFTRELFHDKFNDYLLELIVLIPNIDQQNELYDIWKSENPTTNWAKKNATSVNQQISQCHHCRQLMFENDVDEHKSHHSDFNADFPSLPSASVSIGRGRGKKNK